MIYILKKTIKQFKQITILSFSILSIFLNKYDILSHIYDRVLCNYEIVFHNHDLVCGRFYLNGNGNWLHLYGAFIQSVFATHSDTQGWFGNNIWPWKFSAGLVPSS